MHQAVCPEDEAWARVGLKTESIDSVPDRCNHNLYAFPALGCLLSPYVERLPHFILL